MKNIFKLLHAFCPNHLYEEIEGDLNQGIPISLSYQSQKFSWIKKVSYTFKE